jgi:general secretion pathway protein A
VTATVYELRFSFFGLQRNPFNVSPDRGFFFSTPAHESLLAELLFAIQARQGLMLLTGDSGSGKTTLLQQLLDTLSHKGVSTAYVFYSSLGVEDLYQFILQDFGVTCKSSRKGAVIQVLHRWLLQRRMAGDTPVIIIDEAQTVPAGTLDELRLLLNLESSDGKLVQIVLAGQPEFDEKLQRTELLQLRQRVMFRCRLPLLSPRETSAYIQSRLAHAGGTDPELFPEETVAAIYGYSKGIPRVINLLGERALINAYAEQKRSISPDDILYIASDFDLVENPLSLGTEESSLQSHRVLPFPQLSPEPSSLSALRLAFISELSKVINNSAVKYNLTRPGPTLLSLTPPGHPEVPLGPGATGASAQVPAPTEGLQAAGCSVASAGVPREEAPASRRRRLKEPHASRAWRKRRSHLARYWGDVAYSFNRDLQRSHLTRYWGDVAYSFNRDLQRSHLTRYWGDVAYSFRRDLRIFYLDCRRFLRS